MQVILLLKLWVDFEVSFTLFIKDPEFSGSGVSFYAMIGSISFRISLTIWLLMLLYSIVSNILLVASLVGLAVAGWGRFCEVSTECLKNVPGAVVLSVMLNVAAWEGDIVSGGSIEERELLNEELDRNGRSRLIEFMAF